MDRRAWMRGAGMVALAACARPTTRSGTARRVIVVGAGLAGLVAARELSQAGHEVIVLEARERPGGRIETLRAPFDDGLYAEAGALFIPDTHGLALRYCRALDLPLHRVGARGAAEIYHVRGVRVTLGEARGDAWPLPLTDDERRLGLAGMWQRYIGAALADLGPDHDRMTAAEFLRMRGASAAAVTLLGLGVLGLIGEGLASYSALMLLRDLARRRAERDTYAIVGGNDRLPRALAARLGDRVRYRTPVTRLEPGAGRVTVVAGDSAERLDADRVVCAIPASVLRALPVSPGWSPDKQRAIDTVRYTSVTRVFIQTRARVWGDRHLSLTTDGAIPWIWESSAGQPGARGIVEAYVTGAEARRLASLPALARAEVVRRELDAVQPGLAAAFERAASKTWDDDRWARGAYAWFAPGEITRLAPALIRPERGVHFAGEHTSTAPGWMEGAIESALRVVDEIHGRV